MMKFLWGEIRVKSRGEERKKNCIRSTSHMNLKNQEKGVGMLSKYLRENEKKD